MLGLNKFKIEKITAIEVLRVIQQYGEVSGF